MRTAWERSGSWVHSGQRWTTSAPARTARTARLTLAGIGSRWGTSVPVTPRCWSPLTGRATAKTRRRLDLHREELGIHLSVGDLVDRAGHRDGEAVADLDADR